MYHITLEGATLLHEYVKYVLLQPLYFHALLNSGITAFKQSE